MASSGCQSYSSCPGSTARGRRAGLPCMACPQHVDGLVLEGEDVIRRVWSWPACSTRPPSAPGPASRRSSPGSSRPWVDPGLVGGCSDHLQEHIRAVLPQAGVEVLGGGFLSRVRDDPVMVEAESLRRRGILEASQRSAMDAHVERVDPVRRRRQQLECLLGAAHVPQVARPSGSAPGCSAHWRRSSGPRNRERPSCRRARPRSPPAHSSRRPARPGSRWPCRSSHRPRRSCPGPSARGRGNRSPRRPSEWCTRSVSALDGLAEVLLGLGVTCALLVGVDAQRRCSRGRRPDRGAAPLPSRASGSRVGSWNCSMRRPIR